MVKEKSSNSRIFDKDGYRKVSIKNCENLYGKAKKMTKKKRSEKCSQVIIS